MGPRRHRGRLAGRRSGFRTPSTCASSPTRASEVEAFHAAGLAAGGTNASAPRRWPIYRRGEFNAVLRDPDGNAVEAVSPE